MLFCVTAFAIVVFIFISARWLAQVALEALNRRHVRGHAGAVPEAFRDVMDEPTYNKSVQYTLAKARLNQVELTWETIVLLAALFSGVLPWLWEGFVGRFGVSIWSGAAFLFASGLLLSLPGLPLDWYAQFHLEEKFGFNTMTPRLWWLDRFKGLLLSLVLGFPLLALILKLVDWTGPLWWFWAWVCVVAFQLIMSVVAPMWILPLFNKLTPLPEGSLRERLLKLAERTGFHARSIQVMDGSKRSRHSNAFFTGFKRFRKIVLFDTLVEQLGEPEVEAVLAHEIGHYQKGHIPRMLIASALMMLAGFGLLGYLAGQEWFQGAFGFSGEHLAPTLLLFSLLAGVVSFWISPLAHWWSRKFEFEADAYAADVLKESRPLVSALRKLSERNLSNLTPHPAYGAVYYSHPTLVERERALAGRNPEITTSSGQ